MLDLIDFGQEGASVDWDAWFGEVNATMNSGLIDWSTFTGKWQLFSFPTWRLIQETSATALLTSC